jgi:hypothetical protein
MTDHLDEAATKAVELAALLTTPTDLDETLRVGAAQHLTHLAGLIRGGAVREPAVTEELVQQVGRVLAVRWAKLVEVERRMNSTAVASDGLSTKTIDPRAAAANFRASAAAMTKDDVHQPNWAAGVAHGYLMAADALDEVAEVVDRTRAQRDELLAAARKFMTEQTREAELAMDELVTTLEAGR